MMQKPSVMTALFRRSSGTGPKMGSRGYRKLQRWNQGFGSVSDFFGLRRCIQEEEVGRWSFEGPTRVEGTPRGGALHPHGAHVAPPTYFFLLYMPMYPQTTRYVAKNLIPRPQPSVPVRSHLGAFSGAPLEGALITEGFYINTIASLMMCKQFTSDLRVHSYQLDGFFSLFGSQYKVLLDSLGDLFDVIFFCGVFVETDELWVYDQVYL